MVTLGVDGLASGLDTTSIIANLMKIEAKPQELLKTQQSAAQAKALAYRTVNTRFDAVRTAAEALTANNLAAARTAVSTTTTVSASASATAIDGSSISFRVEQTAASKQILSTQAWGSATEVVRGQPKPAWPIKVLDSSGAAVGSIDLPADATLTDAVVAVNGAGYGVHATIVQLGPTEFRLQITSAGTGSAGARTLQGADENTQDAESGFETRRAERNAVISLDGTNGRQISSSTNTFAEVIPGVTWTVSKADPAAAEPTTITIGSDGSAMAGKVKTLVDAVNGALASVKTYTQSIAGAAVATLQGDRSLVQLSDQVLSAVSSAIGGKSAAVIGLQLNKDGTIAFDPAVFTSSLAADPGTVKAILAGTTATTTGGGTTPAVDGVATKLAALAKSASDSSTGTLVQLARGRDSLADSLQDRIDAFDIRLEARKATLTKQFTILETSLNTIKNQSSWLSSQIGQLYNPNKSS